MLYLLSSCPLLADCVEKVGSIILLQQGLGISGLGQAPDLPPMTGSGLGDEARALANKMLVGGVPLSPTGHAFPTLAIGVQSRDLGLREQSERCPKRGA